MVIVYGGIAILAAIVGTFALMELATWFFDDERRRLSKRRLKKAANSKKKRA